jgi:hypothetical protein
VQEDEMGQIINGDEILDGNPERMRPLQTRWYRCENIKELGSENVVGSFMVS